VYEHILALLARDEAVTLLGVEELNCTDCHEISLLKPCCWSV
jgi:hypothetical protein